MKTAEVREENKQRLTSKLGVSSEKQDVKDLMPKSAVKCLYDATGKSVIVCKISASGKTAVSNVSITDSPSDTESSDLNNSPQSKVTRTLLSSSESFHKTSSKGILS